MNQEEYLKVFLTDGNVPVIIQHLKDPSVHFVLERKIGYSMIPIKGAQASAVIYSLSETAKLNNLRPYYYFKYLLTELLTECRKARR